MGVHEVTYYQAKCDGCGFIETDYDEFTAFGDADTAIDQVLDGDWFMSGGDTLLCPQCQKCEVCQSDRAYPIDDHIVCEEHKDHDFSGGAA